jgi:phosphatidylserine/phosphatidylglycerophosphate/cardiolipin synthase-like enzyme
MPLIKGINRAKKSVEIIIFRFNRSEIEKALAAAVTRGVRVHALIAYTNRGGEQRLRDLELRLLAAGVTVSRTDGDLVRYHSKLLLIDRRLLYVLAFNFTYLDMERSRSFGIVTTNKKHVEEAAKLFEADARRHAYTAGSATFIVSPVNARKRLTEFVKSARKELLIYDPEISDPAIVRTLEARARAGVSIRIIGKLKNTSTVIGPGRTPPMRLHTRAIVRDGSWAFVGSQSLRALELDARREVGIIFRDPKVIARITKTFEEDWAAKSEAAARGMTAAETSEQEQISASKVAKKVARAVVADLDPANPAVRLTMEEISAADPGIKLDHAEMGATVKEAVKEAVKQVVLDFVEQAASESQGAGAKR